MEVNSTKISVQLYLIAMTSRAKLTTRRTTPTQLISLICNRPLTVWRYYMLFLINMKIRVFSSLSTVFTFVIRTGQEMNCWIFYLILRLLMLISTPFSFCFLRNQIQVIAVSVSLRIYHQLRQRGKWMLYHPNTTTIYGSMKSSNQWLVFRSLEFISKRKRKR